MRTLCCVFLLLIAVSISAIKFPKSSLEIVKRDLETQLIIAQKNNNHKETARLQADLNKIERKIKKFHHEWAGYRKRQLQARSQDAAATTEIHELDAFLVAND